MFIGRWQMTIKTSQFPMEIGNLDAFHQELRRVHLIYRFSLNNVPFLCTKLFQKG